MLTQVSENCLETTVSLTKRQIDAAAYPLSGNARHVIWDDDPKGLGLRVYPSGRKTFVVYYRDSGGADRLATIGDYGVFTLDQARDAARDMLRQAESGGDALKVRRAHKAVLWSDSFGHLDRCNHAPTEGDR